MLKQCLVAVQVLKAEAHTPISSVLRWFNTIAYHPQVSEYIGPVTVLPAADPTSSSSSARPPPANGHPSGGVSRGVPGLIAAAAASSGSSAGASAASQEADGQDKPKGKAAKGGKLAQNDVAKGHKKMVGKEAKAAQATKAPQGQGTHLSPMGLCFHLPFPISYLKCCLILSCSRHAPIHHFAALCKFCTLCFSKAIC